MSMSQTQLQTQQTNLDKDALVRVRRAIEEIRAGRMVILVDDEDRENEGDLTMAADMVTAEAINFMVTHGRGLICLALTGEHIDRLRLPMMQAMGHEAPSLGTAFTVSIEAREGVTTGISASDRAQTIRVASRLDAKPEDLLTPGHVFPLRARNGGVLVRTGQTEGAVDLARAAGMSPAGVICEVMNQDGSMARLPDLKQFASIHNLVIVSIADLIQYRTRTEKLVHCVCDGPLPIDETDSEWHAYVYESVVDQERFLALVKGNPRESSEPVVCRVHRGSVLGDVFSCHACESAVLKKAIRRIEKAGCGVVLYLSPNGDILREFQQYQKFVVQRQPDQSGDYLQQPNAFKLHGYGQEGPLRDFGLGAQILADLGVRRMVVLTDNPRRIAGIGGYGIEVIATEPLHDHPVENLSDA